MTAFSLSCCSCTATCCTCGSYTNNYVLSYSSEPEPVARFIPGVFKTWLIWVTWKLELPPISAVLLSTFDLLPSILRPRTRERRHVQGHSPRRVQ